MYWSIQSKYLSGWSDTYDYHLVLRARALSSQDSLVVSSWYAYHHRVEHSRLVCIPSSGVEIALGDCLSNSCLFTHPNLPVISLVTFTTWRSGTQLLPCTLGAVQYSQTETEYLLFNAITFQPFSLRVLGFCSDCVKNFNDLFETLSTVQDAVNPRSGAASTMTSIIHPLARGLY